MNYAKSAIFSEAKKVDSRNLCLAMNFKNEKLDNMCEFIKLLEKTFIDKFAEDFVFDIYFKDEDVVLKALRKRLQKIESYIDRSMTLVYDGLLKCDEVSSRADYRALIQNHDMVGEPIELNYDFKDAESVKKYIEANLTTKDVDYFMEPMPQDIGLNFVCEYKSREEQMDFGYEGSLIFNISGHILNHDYDYYIEYLKDFLRASSEILHSQCANIFISDKKYSTDYYIAFGLMPEYDERCLLRGVEGINFVNKGRFEELDSVFVEEFAVEECKNGYFVNCKKPLDKVDIEDKYNMRDLLNPILARGAGEFDLIQFIFMLGSLPVYLDEIILIEDIAPVENTFLGEEFDLGEIGENKLSKFFIITSNSEGELFEIDPARFKEYRFTF